jgi:hypothetical protein
MAPKFANLPKDVRAHYKALERDGEDVEDLMYDEHDEPMQTETQTVPVRASNLPRGPNVGKPRKIGKADRSRKVAKPAGRVVATSQPVEPVTKPVNQVQGGVQKVVKRKTKTNTDALLLQVLERLVALETQPKPAATSTNATQVRVPTPAPFCGRRGTFAFFASKVESYAQISNISPDKWVPVALQCMEERPCKVWNTYVKRRERENTAGSISWKEFVEFMSKRYDATDLVTMSRSKLDHVYQGKEGVEKYIERFVTLLADVETEYEICENDKIYMFLKGLHAPIRLACTVNPATGMRFSDLDTLCTYVVQYETNLRSGGMCQGQEQRKPFNNAVKVPFVGSGRGSKSTAPKPPVPAWGAVGGPSPAKIDSRSSIPKDRQCYFCGHFGHEAWGCRKKQRWLQNKNASGNRQALPPPPPRPPTAWKDDRGGDKGRK